MSILSLAVSLDPSSHGITYLPDDNSQAALKQLLQRLINNSSSEGKECEEGSSKEKEAAPPPKTKSKVKKLKIKILNWISFLEQIL